MEVNRQNIIIMMGEELLGVVADIVIDEHSCCMVNQSLLITEE